MQLTVFLTFADRNVSSPERYLAVAVAIGYVGPPELARDVRHSAS